MKSITLLTLSLGLFSASSNAGVDELFVQSLKNSKQIEIIELTRKKAIVDIDAVSSTLYPSLDLVSSGKYGNNTTLGDGKKIDTQVGIALNQKVFQGGAEFAINDLRKLLPQKARSEEDLSLSNYYREFTSLYFQLFSANQEKEKIQALLENLKKRVAIVRQRAKIGKDRKADLFALESQLYRLRADFSSSISALSLARTNFSNFTGVTEVALSESEIDPLSLKLDSSVDLGATPTLKDLKIDEQQAILDVKIEEATRYPQVDLGVNYIVDKTYSGANDWEVSLNLKLNILDFGEKSSNIESKRIARRIITSKYNYNRGNSKRIWSNYIANFKSKKEELKSLRNALSRSQASYRQQLEDLKKGLVTQIDVIRSLDDVVSLEKLAIRSSLEIRSLYYQAIAFLGNYPKA